MAGLTTITGNRFESLVEELARFVSEPLDDPLAPEVIVVQSRGMERWISMELSRRHGICAHTVFPFPNAFLDAIFCDPAVGGVPGAAAICDPDWLTFKVMQLLPGLTAEPPFKKVAAYLRSDPDGLKRYQLSRRLADLYDQYLLFRPDMIDAWEHGKNGSVPSGTGRTEEDPDVVWQAALWRRIIDVHPIWHRARIHRRLVDGIPPGSDCSGRLPQRVSVFGISYLPPFHLQMLASLAESADVAVFALNPCRQYWGDIFSERELHTIRRRSNPTGNTVNDLYLHSGNRLLASMGTQGRSFFDMLNEFDCHQMECFRQPEGSSMLDRIQGAVLDLQEPESVTISPDDRSIQIHRCHSPMREIEVLHDQLLGMFEQHPDLQPQQVVVMAPDIDRYAPYVQAVFGTQTQQSQRIPYTIADRNARRSSRFVEGLFALLDLQHSRLSAVDVLTLLDYPGFKERFSLSDSELTDVERWVADNRIRWGIDSENRLEMGLPAFAENTWRFGLQRLLLGYAMPGDGRELFQGILPYDQIEGSEVQTLGKLISFTETLFKWVRRLGRPHPLRKWKTLLNDMLEQLVLPDEDGLHELQTVRQVLENLAEQEIEGGFNEAVSLAVLRSCLMSKLTTRGAGSGFLAGGVTFCAMLPMRSIPARVVCLIGMDNEHFPRESHSPTFDLIAKTPRRGDRSRRNDDKYLFLESMLSARLIFYISYIGLSIENNKEIEPSVLVSELLDALDSAFRLPDASQTIRRHLETTHRLQAFSPSYFGGGDRLFSYSVENRDAARKHVTPSPPRAFFPQPLILQPDETANWSHIDLTSFQSFFEHPARFVLNRRLGLRLEVNGPAGDDREQFVLRGLDRFQIEQDMFQSRLAGVPPEHQLAVQKAGGRLPHGRVGEVIYDRVRRDIEDFVEQVHSLPSGKQRLRLDVDLELAGITLTGHLGEVTEKGLFDIRFARQRAKDLLRTWIRHLILCELQPAGIDRQSFLLTKSSSWHMGEPNDSRRHLLDLMRLFQRGLTMPIVFFPETAFEYVVQMKQRGKTQTEAMVHARRRWQGSLFQYGESNDPYYRLCFEGQNPLEEDFPALATMVYEPILKHCKQIAT